MNLKKPYFRRRSDAHTRSRVLFTSVAAENFFVTCTVQIVLSRENAHAKNIDTKNIVKISAEKFPLGHSNGFFAFFQQI